MTVIIPPGYSEISVHFVASGSGRACTSVFGMKDDDVLTQSVVDSISTAMAAAYKPVLGTSGSYVGLRVLEGQDGGVPLIWESAAGAGLGTKAGALLTPQTMALIRKGTGLATRQGIGRTFLPDVVDSHANDNGGLTSAGITLYSTFANAVLAALFASSTVILHTTSRVPDVVASYAVESKVATLRPRYPRA